MDNKYYQSLQEIIDCIIRIDEFTGTTKKFENYDKNIMMQQAVERNFEIVGEAIKRILEIKPDVAILNTRKIINMRNKIAHGYDEIENVQVWNIIINNLPLLKTEVEKLLSES